MDLVRYVFQIRSRKPKNFHFQNFAYKKLAFSKQADQFLMKTPNSDKQAEKFLVTPVKKTEKHINVYVLMPHTSS